MTKAIYAGTFDPPTNGHQYVLDTASRIFDEVEVSVGVNPAKKTLFTLEERKLMLVENSKYFSNIKVTDYSGEFLIDYAMANNCDFIVRGIRSTEDYNYEAALKLINERLSLSVETIYLIPPRNLSEVSSSVVKSLLGFKRWERVASQYVSPFVLEMLKVKVNEL